MGIDPQFFAGAASVAGAWLWKEYGKDIINQGFGAVWRKFKFPEAKKRYQKRLKELYSTMRVLYKFEAVPLNDYYVDLFVLEEPEAHRKYGIEHLESNFDETIGFYDRGNRTEALLIAQEYDRLFVLGKPGAGKTTFLKYLASLAAEEKIDKVPIVIPFNNWAYSQKNLSDFIVEQFEICGFPDAEKFIESLLDRGNAFILFDGLDEVREEESQRGQMIYELENLVNQYPNNKFVITCRNAANDYTFHGFTYVEIADLAEYQISTFVKKWFRSNLGKATEFLTELAKEEHQNLKELSHNPLLLGMLCLVFEETLHFPSKRGIVYRDAIDALTKKWDKDRGIQRNKIAGFSSGFEKKLLSFIAHEFSLENKIFFGQNDIERKIEQGSKAITTKVMESKDILSAVEVQHGLLAQRARRVYSFSHLTFQEYFTAQYIIDHLETEPKLLDDLFGRLFNFRWREVFPLVASLIPVPDTFFNKFLSRIREPIKKDRTLINTIKRIDELAKVLEENSNAITGRMKAIALSISISKIAHIIQASAKRRSLRLAQKLMKLLNLDETVITIEKATGIAEILTLGLTHKDNNRNKINKVIRLASEQSYRADADIGDPDEFPFLDVESVIVNLRNQLRDVDEELTRQIKDDIQYLVEKNLMINLSLKIVLDFRPTLVEDIVKEVNKLDFPRTFASEEEWYLFKKKLLQPIAPVFVEKILELKEDHLPVLEQFLKSNVFLLDCLRQTNINNYEDYVFNMKRS